MAGIKRGSIEHVLSTANQDALRDMFAATVRFFDAHPQMTRIASQGGSTTATGTVDLRLPGFTSDSNRSGENAFGVWRWDKVNGSKLYILMQWSYNNSIGSAPGNPAVSSDGASSLMFQFAMDTSGGNPWNGGVANLGADTKNATNVWVPNGGTLLVWPRANGPGGAGATIRQYGSGSVYPGAAGSRLHMITDDDAFWWWIDRDGNGTTDRLTYIGPYIPHEQITLADPNAALLHMAIDASALGTLSGLHGTTAGSSSFEGGAVVAIADGVRSYRVGVVGGLNNALHSPNNYTGGYDEHDVFVRMEDATAPSRNGLFGKLDPTLSSIVAGLANGATNVDLTRIVAGSAVALDYKYLLPWDGVTTPGSGASNLGIQFP